MQDISPERGIPIEGTSFELQKPTHSEEVHFLQGKETETRDVIVEAHREGRDNKELKGRFILKKCDIYGLTQEQRDAKTAASYEKLMKLREINTIQKLNGGHQFNLPPTIRLVKDSDGSLSILETNLIAGKAGKKLNFIDLKYADEWDFDADTRQLIEDSILKDFDLAAAHDINLSEKINTLRPLDTWCMVIDHDTGEKKIYILDVGSFVKLNDTKQNIEESRRKIEGAVSTLHIGENIQRVAERAKPDPEGDEENGSDGY